MATCDRCHKTTAATIMSWFNTQNICMDCRKEEEDSPRIKEAKKAEAESIRNGNYNFRGIGL